MNYLLINGSPHKGNTWKLALLAKEQLTQLDAKATFKEIHLLENNLPFCVGCSLCFRQGHEACPHQRIMLNLIADMEAADGIILLSGVFNMRETALLKNFFDHLCFMLHRPHFFHSKALILTTAGGIGSKAAAKSIGSFLYGIGFNRCYTFAVNTQSWNDYHISKKTALKLSPISERFHKDVTSQQLHAVKASLLIPYNLFRGMSSNTKTAFQTKDHQYYFKKSLYATSIPLPFYKKPIGWIFYFIGKIGSKFMTVTYKNNDKNGF